MQDLRNTIRNQYKVELIYHDTWSMEKPTGQQVGIPPHDIRVTHKDSGIIAQCGIYGSYHKNREVAMRMVSLGVELWEA